MPPMPRRDGFNQEISSRSRLVAALFCWFLGFLGIHRFYVGKTGTGILMIVTLGGLWIWAFVDLIVILAGSFKDIKDRELKKWL